MRMAFFVESDDLAVKHSGVCGQTGKGSGERREPVRDALIAAAGPAEFLQVLADAEVQ